MSDCDSCSGCPASADPGTCEDASKQVLSHGLVQYTIESDVDTCRGCVALGDGDLCQELSAKHKCATNSVIFARVPSRLSPSDFDELKKKAIELHAGEWLHHWGRLVEDEVLRRNGVIVK